MQGNESRVSHASLWTSLYPLSHNFISEKAKLDPKFVTLAEAVKPSGRYTAGLMGNGFIDAFWGFGDGWDMLKNHIHEGGGLKAEDFVVERQADCSPSSARSRFFLYIGTIDAHVSWRAHAPWIAQVRSRALQRAVRQRRASIRSSTRSSPARWQITERDKTRIIALYDSDVSYNDQQFGKLVDAAEARPRRRHHGRSSPPITARSCGTTARSATASRCARSWCTCRC